MIEDMKKNGSTPLLTRPRKGFPVVFPSVAFSRLNRFHLSQKSYAPLCEGSYQTEKMSKRQHISLAHVYFKLKTNVPRQTAVSGFLNNAPCTYFELISFLFSEHSSVCLFPFLLPAPFHVK